MRNGGVGLKKEGESKRRNSKKEKAKAINIVKSGWNGRGKAAQGLKENRRE